MLSIGITLADAALATRIVIAQALYSPRLRFAGDRRAFFPRPPYPSQNRYGRDSTKDDASRRPH